MDRRVFYWTRLLDAHLTRSIIEFGGDPMAVEIKGLRSTMEGVRKRIAMVRDKAQGFAVSADALSATLDDLTKQMNEHHEDVTFDATKLGNEQSVSDDAKVRSFRDVGLGDLVQKTEGGDGDH